jgi:AcrR family transcriptional regulator
MSSEMKKEPKRPYRKRRRAEQEDATKQRITEAAVDLHGTIGPVRTTISALAERAGVQRATVYRHFPDEEALFGACSAHWVAEHPLPDFSAWTKIEDPEKRLRTALTELYAWYAEGAQMIELMNRDAPLVPALAARVEGINALLGFAAETVVAGRSERGSRRRRVEAAVEHALEFGTWKSLVGDGRLAAADAVELMSGLVELAAQPVAKAARSSKARPRNG